MGENTTDHAPLASDAPCTNLLASDWREMSNLFEKRKHLNSIEIELVRLSFYVGAMCVIDRAVHSPSALLLMASELRAFGLTVMPEGEHDAVHQHREAI